MNRETCRLSAFADEIAPDLSTQLTVLRQEGIQLLDLRSVESTNVLNFTKQQAHEMQQSIGDNGLHVAVVASPIGKSPVNMPLPAVLEQLERAVEVAQILDTSFIRIFSFYPPDALLSSRSTDAEEWRQEVLQRLQALTVLARACDVTLLLENEKGTYGDTLDRCLDLLQSIDSRHFQAILDPTNFIQCGQLSSIDAYQVLRPWLCEMHVKDICADGRIVVAGQGTANWPELLTHLVRDDYQGLLSLEPHLAKAERSSGFSGRELFRQASQAFQQLLRNVVDEKRKETT